MAQDFVNLRIWRLGFSLLNQVYTLTDSFPTRERYALSSQICRSSNGVIANIAEATGRYYVRDKVRVLYIARGELQETKIHLLVAKDLGYCNDKLVHEIVQSYNLLLRQLNQFIKILVTN